MFYSIPKKEKSVEKAEIMLNNTRKPFKNLPKTCPWNYKTPIFKQKTKTVNKSITQASQNSETTKQNQNIKKDLPLIQDVRARFEKQYQHFARLMQLFPTVHPALIHGILATCDNDFFYAVNKLLSTERQLLNRPNENNNYRNLLCYPVQCSSTLCQHFTNCRCNMSNSINKPIIRHSSYNRIPKFNNQQGIIIKQEIPTQL